jgi:hypothetical protein
VCIGKSGVLITFRMDSAGLIFGQLHSGLAPSAFNKLDVASHASRLSALLVAKSCPGLASSLTWL